MWNVGEIHRLIRDENTGDHKVSLFLRQLKRGERFYARFKIDDPSLANNQRYITESLKTDDLEIASQRARERYALLKVRQDAGIAIKQITVDEAINRFLSDYESRLKKEITGYTKHMARTYRKTIDIYWREYLGQKGLDSVSVLHLQDYEIWRQDWARNTKRKRKHGNYKARVSERTIQSEITAFKALLRWCAGRGFYNRRAHEWRQHTEGQFQ